MPSKRYNTEGIIHKLREADVEPPRVYRRLFSLSQAALADFPSCR